MSNGENVQGAVLSAAFPEAAYTNVTVTPVKSEERGELKHGTGAYKNGVFTCGVFGGLPENLPEVGAYYNILATTQETVCEFTNWKCTVSGSQSQFKAK